VVLENGGRCSSALAARTGSDCLAASGTKFGARAESIGAQDSSWERKTLLGAGVISWRTIGPARERCSVSRRPSGHQAHRFAATRTARSCLGRIGGRSWTARLNRWRQLPGLLLLSGEQGWFFQQSAHAIGPHFGRQMQPAA